LNDIKEKADSQITVLDEALGDEPNNNREPLTPIANCLAKKIVAVTENKHVQCLYEGFVGDNNTKWKQGLPLGEDGLPINPDQITECETLGNSPKDGSVCFQTLQTSVPKTRTETLCHWFLVKYPDSVKYSQCVSQCQASFKDWDPRYSVTDDFYLTTVSHGMDNMLWYNAEWHSRTAKNMLEYLDKLKTVEDIRSAIEYLTRMLKFIQQQGPDSYLFCQASIAVDMNPATLFKAEIWRKNISSGFKKEQAKFRNHLMDFLVSWKDFYFYRGTQTTFEDWVQIL